MSELKNAEHHEPFFSYSADSRSRSRRAAIAVLEKVTGYKKLEKLYLQALSERSAGESFWSAAVRALNIQVDLAAGSLAQIPESGPLVVIANHPFGVLDGVILNHLVSQRRSDGKILINAVLAQMRGFSESVLPVDFSGTEAARRTNKQSRQQALEHVAGGGALLVFPAGGVSTSRGFFGQAHDARWRPFAAEAALQAKAPIVPIYFGGQNSRLFQVVSQVSATLRLGLLIHEVMNKMNHSIPVVIGDSINHDDQSAFPSADQLIEHLRGVTYKLADSLPRKSHKPRRMAA